MPYQDWGLGVTQNTEEEKSGGGFFDFLPWVGDDDEDPAPAAPAAPAAPDGDGGFFSGWFGGGVGAYAQQPPSAAPTQPDNESGGFSVATFSFDKGIEITPEAQRVLIGGAVLVGAFLAIKLVSPK